MNEAIVPDVMELLDTYDGRLQWIHINDARQLYGTKGFPDFIIAGPGGILFRECKPHRMSHLKPHQTSWRYTLAATGADYAIWCQEDLDNGTIERELVKLAG